MLFRLTKAIVRYLIQVGAGGGQPLFVGSPSPNDLDASLLYALYNGDDPGVTDLVFNGSVGGFDFSEIPGLVNFSAPNLIATPGSNYVAIRSNPVLASVALPALASTGHAFYCNSNTSLTSLNIGALAVVGNVLECLDNSSLTTLSVPALTSIAGNLTLSGNAFTEATVDAILVKLASIGWAEAGRTVNLSGGTNSPPGSAGLAAKATLEGLGAEVVVN